MTRLGAGAFGLCEGFDGTLTLSENLSIIEDEVFVGCHNLTGSLILPQNIASIGESAFQSCENLTGDLIIGNSVTTIGNSAFWACKKIEYVYLPASLKSIGYQAFYNNNLKTIECEAKEPPVLGDDRYETFGSSKDNINLYVPAESLNLYKTAKEWKDFKSINPIEAKVTEIKLDKSSASISIGENLNLTATIEPENAVDKTIVWSSSDENIATVAEGVVTGVQVGNATITATTANGLTASCEVTVNPVVASGVTLNVADITLLVGQTDKLTATVEPANTTDATIIWASDNETVATVATNGTVTAVSVGVATITATCGNVSASCKVTVNPVVTRPETPSEFARKGNGASCTFVVMMNLSNEALAEQGYKFVYGYTDNSGQEHVLANTDLRYCHTSAQIYNDIANDFWVFAYQAQENGTTVNSDRRHLDGSVDADFDGSQFINNSRSSFADGADPDKWIKPTSKGVRINIVSGKEAVLHICTLNGLTVRSQVFEAGVLVNEEIDRNTLAAGIYVVTVKSGEDSASKKIIIK